MRIQVFGKVLASHPMYDVVDASGVRAVVVHGENPMHLYSELHSAHILDHRAEQLVKAGVISEYEGQVLKRALDSYRGSLMNKLEGRE